MKFKFNSVTENGRAKIMVRILVFEEILEIMYLSEA